MSVTLISATVFDNPALLRVNPEYLAWLLSLPTLELERLLAGDWKIRPAAGLYFKRDWCSVVDQAPADLDIVRYSDLAVTKKPSSATGLSASSSVAIGAAAIGRWIWCGRAPTRRRRTVVAQYRHAGRQAGQDRAERLHGTADNESGDKLTWFGPFCSQCRAGNVEIRRGSWNEELFRVLEGFPDLAHDDEVDVCSGALEMLNPQMKRLRPLRTLPCGSRGRRAAQQATTCSIRAPSPAR